ncbi:MAG: hypothetical protein M1830_006839 [Pleopsidium flavum]|nr:MAG: hypothetical protein M1830_006839 [Pleopsidium flavum]
MSDRGQGIRLFSSEFELRRIFEEWEAEQPDSDEDDNDADSNVIHTDTTTLSNNHDKDYIVTSQLRHFIAQPYIHPPLLLSSSNNHKFHIRTYVLAVGSLRVYVYKEMLALFAATSYTPPGEGTIDLTAHLTNTCLQTDPGRRRNTTLPNAFEIFGVDFMVDEMGSAWLLEVNAFPDFAQTGEELRGVVGGLWEGVVGVVVPGFFGIGGERKGSSEFEEGASEGVAGLEMVLDLDLGRR